MKSIILYPLIFILVGCRQYSNPSFYGSMLSNKGLLNINYQLKRDKNSKEVLSHHQKKKWAFSYLIFRPFPPFILDGILNNQGNSSNNLLSILKISLFFNSCKLSSLKSYNNQAYSFFLFELLKNLIWCIKHDNSDVEWLLNNWGRKLFVPIPIDLVLITKNYVPIAYPCIRQLISRILECLNNLHFNFFEKLSKEGISPNDILALDSSFSTIFSWASIKQPKRYEL